jgi:hypothetical protein
MDRRHQTDQQLEGTAKPTGNAENAGPRPWEMEKYIYKEEPSEEKRSLHSDPRLELAQRQHQESDFIPSDDDDGYGPLSSVSAATTDLHASAPSASDLGTLAGKKGTIYKDKRTGQWKQIVYNADEVRAMKKPGLFSWRSNRKTGGKK